jgi:outer membrane lipoprotein-sorting protein
MIAAGAVLGSVEAGAAVDLPDKTPQEVLEMVADSDVRALSGTLEQTSELGLPELPEDRNGNDDGGRPGAAAALEMLTGSHTARVYLDGHDKARLQVFDRWAERDVIRNGQDVWLYNSRQNEAVHATLPDHTADKTHAEGYTPEDLAQHFLEAVDPTTEVTVEEDAMVAGRTAYTLVLEPDTAQTLIGSVSLAIDSETGLPLRVEVEARGQEDPAFELGFTELSLETPAAELFAFTPPPGAAVTEHAVRDHGADKPGHSGAGDADKDHKAIKHGTGWETVIELPAKDRPQEKADLLDQLTQPVDGGRLLSTALVNVFLADDGRVFAGSVPLEQLQAAAEGR